MEETEARIRIRKFTPREVFRLMDVDEENIDKLIEAKRVVTTKNKEKMVSALSKTQLYKMAGNSIVVACLENIFESLFYPIKE